MMGLDAAWHLLFCHRLLKHAISMSRRQTREHPRLKLEHDGTGKLGMLGSISRFTIHNSQGRRKGKCPL